MTTWRGRRVLLVEDEAMVAMLVEDMLLELGFEVVEIAARFEDGLRCAESGAFDVAVLDVNLDGTRSYPIADILKRRGTPFVFTTGYGAQGLDPPHPDAAILQKPFQQEALEAALSYVLADGH